MSFATKRGRGRGIAGDLRGRGIDRIDLLVVSHGDADHAGGALSVLAEVPAARVVSSLPPDHPIVAAAATHEPCRAGATWSLDEIELGWLHPDAAHAALATGTDNARSCVLRVRAPGGSVLLTGDIEARQEARLIERTPPDRLRADGIASVVIDCESGKLRLGLAAALSDHLGAEYVPVGEVAADQVLGAVRQNRQNKAA